MRNLHLSLSVKLSIWLIGSMLLIFGLLTYRNVQLHRRDLESMVLTMADRISGTIKDSTRYSMLRNHKDEVYHIMSTIASGQQIKRIRIISKEGRITFSTDSKEIDTYVDKRAEACYACHARQQPLTRLNRPDRMRIYTENHERILGLINPIENEPGCTTAACHAHPPDQQVLGVLDVTMSLAKVDEAMREGQMSMVTATTVAILIVSFAFAVLIYLMVHKPVKKLIQGTKHVAAGNLKYKIEPSSSDELGELARSFNRMTGQLDEANEKITDWARTLESRVAEKTAELKRAHEQILQVEKMASIGKLAAIVAHEINNPLAGILTYSKLMLKKLSGQGLATQEAERSRQYLETIAHESARCGEIVKNLLQFARQAPKLGPNDPNGLVRDSLRLVHHKIELMSLETRLDLDPDVPMVVCDGQQIKQALVALAINACEAMRPGEGILEVGTAYRPERMEVELRVRDNGIGMDEETQQRIFEPFFTTKEQSKGLGLGLSVVYGIVSRHGGRIRVESTPGQGTTFVIELPVKSGEDGGQQDLQERGVVLS